MTIMSIDVPDATNAAPRPTLSRGTPSANRMLRVNLKGIDVGDPGVENNHDR